MQSGSSEHVAQVVGMAGVLACTYPMLRLEDVKRVELEPEAGVNSHLPQPPELTLDDPNYGRMP